MPEDPAADRFTRIAQEGLCIGCGLCQSVAGPERVRVVRTTEGHLRPVVGAPLDRETVDRIYETCPGTRIEGLPEALIDGETQHDKMWGPYRSMVRAYAADPAVRHRGSTGGVLTALATYLVESRMVDFVLHVAASRTDPTFGERHVSFDAASVLAGAGSRYGPTAPLLDFREVLDRGRAFAFVGKPCDVAAVRNLARLDPRVERLCRVMMVPVCGGFMEPAGMARFLASLGLEEKEVAAFSYRGNGCPGPTRIETRDGRAIEKSYLDMWGEDDSAWSLPFRCKVCPDGIGEAADIAAADTWPGGAPTPEDLESDPGTNAILARTAVGQEIVEAAVRDGALTVEREIGPRDLDLYQPHQVAKKYAVWARFAGLKAAGQLTPDIRRLRIAELARENGVAENLRQARGTRLRARQGRTREPRPRPAANQRP